jgi:hypothetical protein
MHLNVPLRPAISAIDVTTSWLVKLLPLKRYNGTKRAMTRTRIVPALCDIADDGDEDNTINLAKACSLSVPCVKRCQCLLLADDQLTNEIPRMTSPLWHDAGQAIPTLTILAA